MNNLQLREQAADRLRDGLLISLRELDRRRQRYTPEALGERVRRSSALRVAGAVTAVGTLGAAIALAIWQRRRNRPTVRFRRLMRKRAQAAKRVWRRPDLLTRETEPPLAKAVGRKVSVILAGAVASALGGQLVDRMTPTQRPTRV